MPKFLISLFFICMTSLVWGQDSQQEKLEQRKAQIQQEIRENQQLLQSVKKNGCESDCNPRTKNCT